jgi:methylenetetrahydrofolate reductase (NADPH)
MERSLIRNGSIELTSGIESIGAATGLLPAAMPVFVPSLPKRPITGNLEALSALKRNGFEPVPHLAARRLLSREELQKFLDVAVREIGVRTIFLIGGDVDTCSGPYESAEDVLRSGILQDAGIASVGIPGYPEPHPRISDTELERSLLAKVELMARAGLDAFVVSQFSLDAGRLVAFCGQMRRRFPNLPLFAGIPGPTNVAKLMKYAKVCGVGASMRALKSMGLKAVRIGNRATSNQQVRALAEYCLNHSQSPVRGVHLFSFGGFRASAEWIGERTGTDVARRSIT